MRIISFFVIVLLVTTRMGITISTHYCGGKAVQNKLSIGKAQVGCGMMDMEHGEVECFDEVTFSTRCCENKFSELKMDSDLNDATHHESVKHVAIATVPVDAYNSTLTSAEAEIKEYLNYKPPLIERDYQVVFQSFII